MIFFSRRFGIGQDFHAKPQKFHDKITPRLGGIGIFVSFFCAYLITQQISFFIIFGLFFVFLSGILEDFLSRLTPTLRLFLQIFGIALLLFSPDAIITNLTPIAILPVFFGVIFSIFGILGACNAINIIDGLNGLSSGIAILIFCAIFFTALPASEPTAILAIFGAFCTAGFFILNFPRGMIFLGDGGAYFLGVLLAFTLARLSNAGISAWFGLAVMIYPIFEVVFSIFRRKMAGHKAMRPDSLHLHSLIFRICGNNAISAEVILIFYAIYLLLVCFCASTHAHYMLFSAGFCTAYTIIYKILSHLSARR